MKPPRLLLLLTCFALSHRTVAEQPPIPLSPYLLAVATELIAEAIRTPDVTVVIGVLGPVDDVFRLPEKDLLPDAGPADDFPAILNSLDLTRVYVHGVIASSEPLPSILYVQVPRPGIISTKPSWHAEMYPDAKPRLLFLSRPSDLSSSMLGGGIGGSKVQALIRAQHGKVPPTEIFKQLGVDKYLNAASWFELYKNQAAFAIDEKITREPSPFSPRREELGGTTPSYKTTLPPPWQFPTGFASDVKELVRVYRKAPANAAALPAPAKPGANEMVMRTEYGRMVERALREPPRPRRQ